MTLKGEARSKYDKNYERAHRHPCADCPRTIARASERCRSCSVKHQHALKKENGAPAIADKPCCKPHCLAPRLPFKAYCRQHWSEYCTERRRDRAREKHYARENGKPTPYRCEKCKIKIPQKFGMCDECANHRPIIQTEQLMGVERFYQKRGVHINAFADVIAEPRRGRGKTKHHAD